jgi:hypothetical protein
MAMTSEKNMASLRWAFFLLMFLVLLGVGEYVNNMQDVVTPTSGKRDGFQRQQGDGIQASPTGPALALPPILFEMRVYQNNSFVNEYGVVPEYWGHEKASSAGNESYSSGLGQYGPCYGYKHEPNWEKQVAHYREIREPWYNDEMDSRKNPDDLQGHCRPGFIIIGMLALCLLIPTNFALSKEWLMYVSMKTVGAGKCGTSSLYHYITSHPKVLPASEKQIHYFRVSQTFCNPTCACGFQNNNVCDSNVSDVPPFSRQYHKNEPLKWYYSHFPSTTSMLAAGGLMSGEASPGYMPYPSVVIDMKQYMPEPRLIVVGRSPIERAYSSYKYNYVDPTCKQLSQSNRDIPKHQPLEFYTQYLYSFEDMIRAELAVLRECLAPGSEQENETRKQWSQVDWISDEYKRRQAQGLPALIDLDGYCYGDRVSDTVLRKQWIDLVREQPEKIVSQRNLHLTQSLIGRSLYLFPLEWWYAAFPSAHIYFVCTEELQDFSGESMNSVGGFLGLPRYENFSTVVQGGAFNVGGHKGYDYETSWSEVEEEHKKDDVPISDELRRELEEFIRPYNERLFKMTGRRCNW